MTPTPRSAAMLRRFWRLGALLVMVAGAMVLGGWIAHIPPVLTLAAGLASMKANTAAGFVALGAALLLPASSGPHRGWSYLGRALAVMVLALGCATLAEYLLGRDLGIDQLVLRDWASAGGVTPGRMAPMTAVLFVFSAASIIAVKSAEPRIARWANWPAGATLFFSTLAIVGYAYGVASLYKFGPFSSMALHAALGFLILSLATQAANPARGVTSLVFSNSAGGIMTRRLLLTLPLATFLLGAICIAGLRANIYDGQLGLSLMVVMSLTVMVAAILSEGAALRRMDHRRGRAEAELTELSAGLERRIQERTSQLAGLTQDLAKANEALKEMSLHDPLTDLPNRRFLDGHLASQIAIARRYRQPLAVLFCDIDGFKDFNDQHGHLVGDAALKRVATALKACCRRPSDMAARYGGEEFILVLCDTDAAGAALVAESARAAVEGLGILRGGAQPGAVITISGGVAVLADASQTASQLVAAADRRLYQAKRLGRNRIVAEPVEAQTALAG